MLGLMVSSSHKVHIYELGSHNYGTRHIKSVWSVQNGNVAFLQIKLQDFRTLNQIAHFYVSIQFIKDFCKDF